MILGTSCGFLGPTEINWKVLGVVYITRGETRINEVIDKLGSPTNVDFFGLTDVYVWQTNYCNHIYEIHVYSLDNDLLANAGVNRLTITTKDNIIRSFEYRRAGCYVS
jgi:hypothetical protein